MRHAYVHMELDDAGTAKTAGYVINVKHLLHATQQDAVLTLTFLDGQVLRLEFSPGTNRQVQDIMKELYLASKFPQETT